MLLFLNNRKEQKRSAGVHLEESIQFCHFINKVTRPFTFYPKALSDLKFDDILNIDHTHRQTKKHKNEQQIDFLKCSHHQVEITLIVIMWSINPFELVSNADDSMNRSFHSIFCKGCNLLFSLSYSKVERWVTFPAAVH